MPHTGDFVVLTGLDLQKCHSADITFFFNIINEAYNKNQRFNIIKSTRIKDTSVFLSDLGFNKHPEECVFILYFEGRLNNYDMFEVKEMEAHKWYTLKKNGSEDVKILPQIFKNKQDILGTVGFKPYYKIADGKHFEVTSFASLKPTLGKFLLPITERYVSTLFDVVQYIAVVIVEHDLVPYYEKVHKYTETKRLFVPKDYDPIATGMEPGIEGEPFHLATMIKSV